MNIKEQIKALLQSKFGGVQLSASRIESIAKRLEGKVTTEEELLQKLETLDEALPFTDIAKEDDRARSLEAAAKAKGGEKSEEKKVEEKKEEVEKQEEMPAWAKALMEGQKAMSDTVAGLKSEKVVTDRQSQIMAKLVNADKDYSAKVLRDFGRMNFADNAAFEEYLGDVETDYVTHTQSVAESKLGKDAPFMGIGDDGKVKEASEAEVAELFGDIKI